MPVRFARAIWLAWREGQCQTCAPAPGRGVLCKDYKKYENVLTLLHKLNNRKLAPPNRVLCAWSRETEWCSVSHCIAVQNAVTSAVSSTLCCFVSNLRIILDGSASSGTPCTRSSLTRPRRNALTSSSFAKISMVDAVNFFSRGKTVQNWSCKSIV